MDYFLREKHYFLNVPNYVNRWSMAIFNLEDPKPSIPHRLNISKQVIRKFFPLNFLLLLQQMSAHVGKTTNAGTTCRQNNTCWRFSSKVNFFYPGISMWNIKISLDVLPLHLPGDTELVLSKSTLPVKFHGNALKEEASISSSEYQKCVE